MTIKELNKTERFFSLKVNCKACKVCDCRENGYKDCSDKHIEFNKAEDNLWYREPSSVNCKGWQDGLTNEEVLIFLKG